ncbi:MAG: efflux RND transporter periplasmic adaptor subunit [Opitutales bacterium]
MKSPISLPPRRVPLTFPPVRRPVTAVGLALVLAAGAGSYLRAEEPEPVVPTVAVALVSRADLYKELTVQAEFRPYQEIDLHAKASGYLRQINVDIGDSVKAGDLIGILEVPELEDDLARAVAAQQRAEADFKEAHLNYARLQSVSQSRPNLVAQQDLDTAEGKDSAMAAAVAAAQAETRKYRTLAEYTRITAPFNGVITKRYADPGALIQAGISSDTQTKPLIRLSENDRLRLDFPVSASYAEEMKVGDPVEIHLDAVTAPLTGVISRFSRRITMETRTMETEVEVPNPDLKLIPGMYATVVLRLQRRPQTLAIPVEAVSGSAHPTVYLVNRNQEIEERPVELGLETPAKYEVLSGLHEGDRVMIGNRSQVHPGQKVSAQPVTLATTP